MSDFELWLIQNDYISEVATMHSDLSAVELDELYVLFINK